LEETFAARRAVLRLFPYALYAVTLRRADEHHGFTANWLTQVSFDPQLIAVSVENDSRSIGLLRDTGIFTVNVLPSGAKDTAGLLGRRSAKVPDKMSHLEWMPGPNGCDVLAVTLGCLESAAPLTMAETGFRHAG
jgi:flavin reductase (DIM6/NTAB) family NADH-FMN oxidoreductase RutF